MAFYVLYVLYALHPLYAFESRPITPDSGHPFHPPRLPDHSPPVTTQVFATMQTCVIM
jgi:hypothetical protein